MRRTSLADRESIPRISFKLSTSKSSDTQKVHLGKENISTAAEVFLTVKKMKAEKAAGCDEIQLEMLKALNRE